MAVHVGAVVLELLPMLHDADRQETYSLRHD